MEYITAPNYSVEIDRLPDDQCIFLAGSISNARDWQAEAAERLRSKYHVFNPRRPNYDTFDPTVELQQITWEHHCLDKCKHILFWFSHETVAPITLFEYGKMFSI